MASTLIGGLATVSPAMAQDDESSEEETIVITGSRIRNANLVAASPVTQVDAEEFALSGTTRVEDLLNTLPQLAPSFDSFTVNPTTGFATADLRGLGTNRTLVLVNGQRLQPGGIRSQAPDLNQIPAGMIQRVEVLTGGASAVYGSDAMAGVVNFILDRNFEGVSITAGASGYQHNNQNDYVQGLLDDRSFDYPTGNSGIDGRTYNFDFAIGSGFAGGRGHASGYFTYRKNEELLQGARDYSSCALNQGGTVCGGSSTAPNPNFFLLHPDLVGFAHFDTSGTWAPGVGELYNYAPINHYQRPDERWTAGAFFNYEISPQFRPYMDFMFANTNTSVQIAQSGTFFVNFLELGCTDPLLGSACADLGLDPADPVGIYVGKRNVEGGPRVADIDSTSYRVVLGSEGDLNQNWAYNTSFMLGINNSGEANRNDFLTNRLEDALLQCPAGSSAGCIPYNVWVPGGVTEEAAAALGGTGMRQGRTELFQVGGYLTGDTGIVMPGASQSVSLVAGAEWRRSNYEVRSDTNMAEGAFTGLGGPRPPISGGYDVTEIYFEGGVPLFANLNAEFGYRYSNYNTSGGVNSYKIAATWDPIEMVRLRGGFNRAIRAANVGELFADQQLSLWGGDDPCAGTTPEFTAAQCANTGVSAAQYGNIQASPAAQYNQFSGGNPNLDPEVADTWTFGFIANPVDNLSVSVDYYNIAIEERIGSIGAATILRFCALTGDPFLCDKVNRNATTGDLWLGSSLATSGHVENLSDNFGNLSWQGIDIAADYSMDLFGGDLGINFVGSIALEQEIEPLPGVNQDATYDCAGVINPSCQTPEWRHTMRFTYSQGTWWQGSLRWRHVGSMDYTETNGAAGSTDQILVGKGGQLPAHGYIDLTGVFDVRENATLTVGVNNLMDREPPLVGSTLSLNANAPGGYDQNGRFLHASINIRY
ncbi:TonB-dependent receptor [Maricaulis sp.]|jgi:outer membrane receptor protein involved in Fe transport|uniref:TonB-dependent receptor domain-containing protein n=1 Tax=Maricaulis sp. TaxID=1486257 RepID=UPI002631C0EF|nr:TonB-dependent receptor [Maricaulis sp.]